MPLFYSIFQSSIESKDGKKKYFPRIVTVGKTVDMLTIAKEVAKKTSLGIGDSISACMTIPDVMGVFMKAGYGVKLDGLGTFRIASRANGTGVDTPEEVTPAQFTTLKVLFTPEFTYNPVEGRTRSLLTGLTFERYGRKLKSADSEIGGSGEENGDDDDPTA